MTSRSIDRSQMMSTLRQEALDDAEKYADKQRFALFSQPPSLATGDDKQYETKQHPRDENGKPVTHPRNILTGGPKSGKVKDSYFSLPGFATVGDPYLDPETAKRKSDLEKKKLVTQDQVFKPASGYKSAYFQFILFVFISSRVNSPYKHEVEFVHTQKSYLDSEGKVITAPRNITTNPKNGVISKPAKYVPEPYDRQRELHIKEIEENKKKLGDKAAFRSTHVGGKTFNQPRKVFGEDGIDFKKRPLSVPKYNIVKHDNPFKCSSPSKKGYNGTISKFPEYKPDPIKPLVRVDKSKERDPFKPKHCGQLTRPTPSITCNQINIRRELMSGRVHY